MPCFIIAAALIAMLYTKWKLIFYSKRFYMEKVSMSYRIWGEKIIKFDIYNWNIGHWTTKLYWNSLSLTFDTYFSGYSRLRLIIQNLHDLKRMDQFCFINKRTLSDDFRKWYPCEVSVIRPFCLWNLYLSSNVEYARWVTHERES